MRRKSESLILKQIRIPIIAISLLLFISFLGYIVIEDYTPLESLYMLVITFATIGYGEVKPLSDVGRIYTIIIILSGFTVGVYSIGKITAFFLEGELTKQLRVRKMNKNLSELRNHYIICGYGKTGQKLAVDLLEKGYKVVVVENDTEKVERLKTNIDKNLIFIDGDATTDEILIQAEITKAKMLVSVLSTDAENLFVTLSAIDLNKNIKVITRADGANSKEKFKKAGADFIISPIEIATDRMLSIATTSTDFFSFAEFVGGTEELKKYKFGLVEIRKDSELVSKTYREANIPQKTNLVVIGYSSRMISEDKFVRSDLQVNPTADHIINLGDNLLVFGEDHQISELRKIANDILYEEQH